MTRNGLTGNGSPPLSGAERQNPGVLIFLTFEPCRFRTLARIALLLDRVIPFPEPRVESLREAYRLGKILWNLNREIEFFLLFRGTGVLESYEELLFERFSLTTSRFLATAPRWLGTLTFPPAGEKGEKGEKGGGNLGFHPGPLLTVEGLRRPLAPEKSRFWHALQERFQGGSLRGSAEILLEEMREADSPFAGRLSREELREFIQFELDTASSKYKS